MESIAIRRYRSGDRECIREIAWQTAFMGEPASAFFEDKEIIADFLTSYFTDYEPQSCFVAEANTGIAGYIIGARNTAVLRRIFEAKIFPRLLISAFSHNSFFKKKNMIFLLNLLSSFIKGEFKTPDFYNIYPATLHINLRKDFRNMGIGSRLVSTYLKYLRDEKISGLQLATMSEAGSKFFSKQGFSPLYCNLRSYLKHVLHRDIPVYVFGRRL